MQIKIKLDRENNHFDYNTFDKVDKLTAFAIGIEATRNNYEWCPFICEYEEYVLKAENIHGIIKQLSLLLNRTTDSIREYQINQ